MKILLQGPNPPGPSSPARETYQRLLHAHAERIKRSETELLLRPAAGACDIAEVANLAARFRNSRAILDSAAAADHAQFDGVVVNCFFDDAVAPIRQMSAIPVTGLAESAMALAPFLGRAFAVLSVNPRYDHHFAEMITSYGHRDRALAHRPVRPIGVTEGLAAQWLVEGRTQLLADAVLPVARACIDDGADVLIFGCGFVSIILVETCGISEIDGVPVITPLTAAVKTIESLIDLRRAGMRTKSVKGYWGEA